MAVYKARITAVHKIGNEIRVDGVLLKDAEEFPMPTVTMQANTATQQEAVALIKTEIQKFQDGWALDAILQGYVGTEITL